MQREAETAPRPDDVDLLARDGDTPEADTILSFPTEDGWEFIEEGGEAHAALTGETATVGAPMTADGQMHGEGAAAEDDRLLPGERVGDRAELVRTSDDEEPLPRTGPSVLDPPLAEPSDDDLFYCLPDSDELASSAQLASVAMVRLGVKGDKIQHVEAGELWVDEGDEVVVETERGLAVGTVVSPPVRCMVESPLPRLIRRVDANDQRQIRRNQVRQQEAFQFCSERIRERQLPMKLVRVEFLHSGNKALFYFSAEHRIDFRELVRDLARHLRVRVEMRQVGVRDAAGMTGGIGSCGQRLCCSRFLQRFEPVSIRMAKDQNLVLNPTKVSGQCGRLKCCLGYEQKLYQSARKRLPKPGGRVFTPGGPAIVRELDILQQLVRVQQEDGSTATYPASAVTPQDQQAPQAPQAPQRSRPPRQHRDHDER